MSEKPAGLSWDEIEAGRSLRIVHRARPAAFVPLFVGGMSGALVVVALSNALSAGRVAIAACGIVVMLASSWFLVARIVSRVEIALGPDGFAFRVRPIADASSFACKLNDVLSFDVGQSGGRSPEWRVLVRTSEEERVLPLVLGDRAACEWVSGRLTTLLARARGDSAFR